MHNGLQYNLIMIYRDLIETIDKVILNRPDSGSAGIDFAGKSKPKIKSKTSVLNINRIFV